MLAAISREGAYLWFYFSVQLEQLLPYWVLGMMLGSAISVFLKNRIHDTFRSLGEKKLGALKIILGLRHFLLHLAYVMLFSLAAGLAVNLIV